QGDGDGGRLVGGEVQRGQGHRGVEGVAAAGPGRGPDGHTRLLEGGQVALDRAHAHLEVLRELAGRPRPGRDGAQLLDERVETIGAVHAPSLVATVPAVS